MTSGDSAEWATELGLPPSWCEVSMANEDGHQVTREEAARLYGVLIEVAEGGINPLSPMEINLLSGERAVVRAGDITGYTIISPAYRRASILRHILAEREERAIRKEHKRYDEDDD
jgi:hypothetical protein